MAVRRQGFETMKQARVRRLGAITVVLAFVLSACTTDWAQWGHGIEKQGWSSFESQVGPNNVGQLREKWALDLGAILDASPVVATGLTVNGRKLDVLYLGTEHGIFYAVDTGGHILWQRDL